MNTPLAQKDQKVGGITANRLAIPIIITIAILLLLIVFLFISISRSSQQLSAVMEKYGEYTADVNGLVAGSSKLSETATTFILMPVAENGEVNSGSLFGYAEELKTDRRGPQVLKRFEDYDVSKEDRTYVAEAAKAADNMLTSQLHALALMNSVYSFTNTPALKAIPLPELTPAEKKYSKERKETVARQLVLGTEYALNKQTVSVDANACTTNLQKERTEKIGIALGTVEKYRLIISIVTILLILVLALTFVLIYQQVLIPLRRITQQIRTDQPLGRIQGLWEVREMAIAYNNLLHRRNTLDSILRSAAETDTLTKLPNRYAFQQYLVESNEQGFSLGVLLFDVNYLKKTNDTHGHAAGDELLRQSADCISSCFGSAGESNCFRLGGDEFAVVIKNPTMEVVNHEVQMFMMEQQRRQISISCGYALASELSNPSLNELIDTADKRMYAQKRAMHEGEADDSRL